MNNLDTQSWDDAYKEMSQLILNEITEIKWVDLWNEQTSFEEQEYPFGMPAVFLDFNGDDINTVGKGVQHINFEVGVHLAFATLADSHAGSINQNSSLEFISLLKKVHALLQAKHGEHFSSMNRINLKRVPTANDAVIQYVQTYTTKVVDYDGMKKPDGSVTDPALQIEKGTKPASSGGLYDVTQ